MPYDEDAMPRHARGCACGNDLPGMCPGPSNCPYNAPDPDPAELAYEEGSRAFSAAEDLAAVLDRFSGDWGEDPDALADITARIAALHAEAVALLGLPRKRTSTGGLVPAMSGADEAALIAAMNNPRYWRDRDPALVRQVRDGLRATMMGSAA